MYWPMIGVLAAATGGAGALWWRNQQAIVDAQLMTHKMMLPRQIRRARRTYARGLIHQTTGPRRLLGAARVLGGLAGLGAIGALALLADQHGWAVTPTLVTLGLSDPTRLIARLTLGAAVAAIGWAALAAWLTHWLYGAQRAADATHVGGPSDLYWTPADRLARDHQLRLIALGLFAALALGLALGATSYAW